MNVESIYTLRLENDNYYIGRSKNLETRINNHFEGNGSVWTRLHYPIEVLSIVPLTNDFQELTTTLKLMKEKSIEKVRGDIFCSEVLSPTDLVYIRKMIASNDSLPYENRSSTFSTSFCVRCGRNSHRIEGCYAKRHINGSNIDQFVEIRQPCSIL